MILGAIMDLSAVWTSIFRKEMLAGALSTVLSFLSSLVSLFTFNMKRDLVVMFVKKVSEVDNLYGSCSCFLGKSYWLFARNSCVDMHFFP